MKKKYFRLKEIQGNKSEKCKQMNITDDNGGKGK